MALMFLLLRPGPNLMTNEITLWMSSLTEASEQEEYIDAKGTDLPSELTVIVIT